MKLFATQSSPFARCVRVLIRELDLKSQVLENFVHPFDNDPDHLAAHPLGKVPVLVDGQGKPVLDSDIICYELDNEFDAKLRNNEKG